MGEIKSAWEIALERTKSVEVDKEAVEADRLQKEGRSLISKYLDNTEVNLNDRLRGYEGKRLRWVKGGALKALLANLVLPQDQTARKKIERVSEGFFSVISDKKLLQNLFSQLESFYDEYLGEKDNLKEALVQQYMPRLKQREEEMSRKTGLPVHIDVETDPEFNAQLRKHLSMLEEKYQSVLTKVKSDLTSIFEAQR
jgi:hypothetical protein